LIYAVGATLATIALLIEYFSLAETSNPHIFVALIFLPPMWVVVEYLFVFDNWEDQRAIKELRYSHALAGVIWLVYLLFYAILLSVWWF
jgi:hypothetical protein